MNTDNIISRPLYMQQIRPYIGKNIIKILVGQRRVGKSYILKAVANEIRDNDINSNIITINLEDFAFSHIDNAQKLYEEITAQLIEHKKNYIFIDEVQEVENFDKVVRSLALDSNNDIYLTGSNSKMLSSEIASRLAGRSITIHVHPLTYREFIDFHNFEDNDKTLNKYLQYGGLPYLINLPSETTWNEYIAGVTDAIVYRDVVNRHSLRNTDFLKRLMLFFADNIGQLFTAKKIADYLKSQRISSSVSSVQTYTENVQEAYIINRVRRWDIEGKRHFEIGEKVFFEDLGMRNSIIGYRPGDIGGLMENVIYNHLKANGYDIKIGHLSTGREIDFIAEKDNELLYIQVAVSIANEETLNREFGNLTQIPDNYEKMVITLNEESPNTYNGIKCKSLRNFLME